ncbi:phosphate/phosphite/phosphonate ABC transporter substrate-binding protein [Rhizobiales bacterium]|uniref:phosphate/phosphite/phosphonate ABC transporter substrate-binding protein n=1 Tax=Hongsoonwoonella zoysiae TaxID=2821844 RepID=UPI00155F7F91|nr:PhnD/SsuA/transferrin family substrate-binding protein [Hongsoonwoonella zoysiae]NRG16143.1 phosphate/phosphite/phosphonate ABC transporter substrate-binding protein [Hongsoonwoonella zoysiae]
MSLCLTLCFGAAFVVAVAAQTADDGLLSQPEGSYFGTEPEFHEDSGAEELLVPLPEDYDAPWPDTSEGSLDGRFDGEMLKLLPSLRYGIVINSANDPDRAAFRLLEPYRASLEAALGVPVNLVAYTDLASLQNALVSGQVDYAELSSSAFAQAWKRCACVEPLAVPLSQGGESAYRAAVIVANGSGYETLEDLQGARLGIGGEGSTAGRRLPFFAFREIGIDPQRHFAALVEVDGPLDGAKRVMVGTLDASLGWVGEGGALSEDGRGTISEMQARRLIEPGSLRVIWRSKPIPNAPHVVRRSLADKIKRRLKAHLLSLDVEDPPAFFAIAPRRSPGFAPIDVQAFAPLVKTFDNSFSALGGKAGTLKLLSGEGE